MVLEIRRVQLTSSPNHSSKNYRFWYVRWFLLFNMDLESSLQELSKSILLFVIGLILKKLQLKNDFLIISENVEGLTNSSSTTLGRIIRTVRRKILLY
jgi:hypothetical protein